MKLQNSSPRMEAPGAPSSDSAMMEFQGIAWGVIDEHEAFGILE